MSQGEPGLPPVEVGELRGPMGNFPLAADAASRTPLAHRLVQGLEARGDEDIAFIYPRAGVRWSAGVVRARAAQLAQAMMAAGVRPGDRVSFVSGSHPEAVPLFLATLLAGAAWAPLNHGFDDGDLRLLLGLIEPRLVLAPPDVARRLRPLVDAMAAEAKAEMRLLAVGEGPEWEAFARPRAHPPPLPAPPADPLSATALIFCSSGTSGQPKAVLISHYSINSVIDALLHEETNPNLQNGRMVITSPLYWVTNVYYTLFSMVTRMTLVYEFGSTEEEFLASVHKHKPNFVFTANSFLLSAAKMHEAKPGNDLSSLQTILVGGASMSPGAEGEVLRIVQCNVQQLFGMTEIGFGFGLTKDKLRKTGSVGMLYPFVQCKLVDPESGLAVGQGQKGELCFKTASITSGYINNPQATADLFDEQGWLHSGDIAYFDEDHYFFVTGRIKDIMKYRGVHVSPVDIEGVLDKHPAVLESAVVGVRDGEEELPRAYVSLRPGQTASAEELCSLIQETLAPHKWLRGGVVFLDALPKTSTGKISRAAIRKRYIEKGTVGS